MPNNENKYNRKSQYNPNRESYVDENGNYVYLVWDSENNSYRREVCVVGEGGFSPEIRAVLDEMDADEDRRLDADRHHMDMVFEAKKRAYCDNQSEYANDPLEMLPQRKHQSFEEVIRESPCIEQLIKAMDRLTPEQKDLIFAIYGEMLFGAEVAREQGVTRQAINNRLNKIHKRLKKLMEDMNEA